MQSNGSWLLQDHSVVGLYGHTRHIYFSTSKSLSSGVFLNELRLYYPNFNERTILVNERNTTKKNLRSDIMSTLRIVVLLFTAVYLCLCWSDVQAIYYYYSEVLELLASFTIFSMQFISYVSGLVHVFLKVFTMKIAAVKISSHMQRVSIKAMVALNFRHMTSPRHHIL